MAEKLWNMLKLLPSISASRKNSLITGLARIDEKTDELILSLYHLPEPAEFLGGKSATYYAWFYHEETKNWVKIGELQRKNGLTFGYRKKVALGGDGLFITAEEKGREIKQPGIVVLASNPEVFYSELVKEESVPTPLESTLEVKAPAYMEVQLMEREEAPAPLPEIISVPSGREEPAAREMPVPEPAELFMTEAVYAPIEEPIPMEIRAGEPIFGYEFAGKPAEEEFLYDLPAENFLAGERKGMPVGEPIPEAISTAGIVWTDERLRLWSPEQEVPAGEPVCAALPQSLRMPQKPAAGKSKNGDGKAEELKKMLSDFYAGLPGDELMGMIKSRFHALKKEVDLKDYWEKLKCYLQEFWSETRLAELWDVVKRDLAYLSDRIGLHNLWDKIETLVVEMIDFIEPRHWLSKAKDWVSAVDEHLQEWYETGKKYVDAILSEVEPALLWDRIKCWFVNLLDTMNIDEIVVWLKLKIRELRSMQMEDVRREAEHLFRQFVDAIKLPELKMAVIKVAVRDRLGQLGGFFQKVKDTATGKRSPEDPNVNIHKTPPDLQGYIPQYALFASGYGIPAEIPDYSYGAMETPFETGIGMHAAGNGMSPSGTDDSFTGYPFNLFGTLTAGAGPSACARAMAGDSSADAMEFNPYAVPQAMGNDPAGLYGAVNAAAGYPSYANGMRSEPSALYGAADAPAGYPFHANGMRSEPSALYGAADAPAGYPFHVNGMRSEPSALYGAADAPAGYPSYANGMGSEPFAPYSAADAPAEYPFHVNGMRSEPSALNTDVDYSSGTFGTPGPLMSDPAAAYRSGMEFNPYTAYGAGQFDGAMGNSGNADPVYSSPNSYRLMMNRALGVPAADSNQAGPNFPLPADCPLAEYLRALPCSQCGCNMWVQQDAMGDPRYVYGAGDDEYFFITPDGEMINRS